MTRDDRFKLYEKLYFQELERREKISARLTLPFGAILATVGLLSFMLNSSTQPHANTWRLLFWSLFSLSSIALLVGAWFFRKAWFGHTDKLLPTAYQIEDYHQKLSSTYEEFDTHDELVKTHFNNFLFDYYVRDSSINAVNNDERSYNIYRASFGLTLAVLLALVTAVPFYIGNTSSGASQMTEPKAPPPPPPPPPERSVKGDTPRPPQPRPQPPASPLERR
jgi:hypothetical protein